MNVALVLWYVLAIDQAAESGWCVIEAPTGRIVAFGLARNAVDRASAVAEALRLAGENPLLVCFEDHSKMRLSKGGARDKGRRKGTRSTSTVLGIGAARGRWQERLELVGIPLARMKHRVDARVWRKAVLGHAFAEKQQAVDYAQARTGRKLDHNVAEAICIGCWAVRNLTAPTARQRSRKAKAQEAAQL